MRVSLELNKDTLTFVAVFLAAIAIVGIASAVTPNPGHSTGEIDWSQTISAGITAN